MLDPQREIQALVDSFVDNLSELARRIAIEQIKAAFAVGAPSLPPYSNVATSSSASSTAKAASPPANGAAAPARRGRRPAQELAGLRERLIAAIGQQPGRRTEDLNAALGTETAQIAPVLRKLVAEQTVRTEGARRGTRYYVSGGRSNESGTSESAQLPLV